MRILLIFLSIGLFFTLVQYSNGAPTKAISSESEEDDSVEIKKTANLKPISNSDDESDENDEIKTQSKPIAIQVDESDQSSEEKQKLDEALEFIQNLRELGSHNVDQDESDELLNTESIVNNDHRRILEDTDEYDE